MTKSSHALVKAWLIGTGILLTAPTMAFDSGSNGADGALNPIVNTVMPLPADGIFNFTLVDIPSGVTLSFEKNTANTPVTFLVSGDVLITGSINLNGGGSTHSGAAGDGNLGDDGIPGRGGPGGFDGGRGGDTNERGGNGLGPGAGVSGPARCNVSGYGGGGGGYGGGGGNSGRSGTCAASGGPSYGSGSLLPLIGGSGGGGGHGGATFAGTGGGGGGGALLIAASGTVTVNGSIVANGGISGASTGTNCGGGGGSGSGGAIRIVATTLAGNGAISAMGGAQRSNRCYAFNFAQGGAGASGRIRLEAETMLRTAATNPGFSFAQPQDAFVAGLPGLSITSVAGVDAPAQPTGSADIVLPETTPNPVEVLFATTDVPLGNTIKLTVTPATGASTSVISDALAGTDANATASASINLPDGPSILSAQVSFTVTASLGQDLSRFAQGEQVERVILAANMTGESLTTLITVSGKEYTLPSNQVALF